MNSLILQTYQRQSSQRRISFYKSKSICCPECQNKLIVKDDRFECSNDKCGFSSSIKFESNVDKDIDNDIETEEDDEIYGYSDSYEVSSR